jgi:hypothetical protein
MGGWLFAMPFDVPKTNVSYRASFTMYLLTFLKQNRYAFSLNIPHILIIILTTGTIPL